MEKQEFQVMKEPNGSLEGTSQSGMEESAGIDTKPESSSSNTVSGDAQTPTEDEYLSGFRLVAVLSAATMAAFLMLLDASVVVTAS
jgi:hypothetical protein